MREVAKIAADCLMDGRLGYADVISGFNQMQPLELALFVFDVASYLPEPKREQFRQAIERELKKLSPKFTPFRL